ncbi:hypothetical protein ACK399_00890 [Aeromonas veronii]|uniref:hypothetical protein n=1 Tax=Aeromonas TaxID=642 RepID=UPI0027144E8D|nr:hypothetical protein [Aeromonas veronii]WLD22123.1 hypothetical protein O1Q77_09000 [Aeromonas veronii]BED99202.1 hypothetical protein VAWG001_08170 [Aeromonas dhakensis]
MPRDDKKQGQLTVTQKQAVTAKFACFEFGYQKEIRGAGSPESCSQFMFDYNRADVLEPLVIGLASGVVVGAFVTLACTSRGDKASEHEARMRALTEEHDALKARVQRLTMKLDNENR